MARTKQDRELFIRRLSRFVALAMETVERDFGKIDTTEVARRVARTLWAKTDLQGHQSVAAWVRHIRHSTGKTQAEFAQALETTQVTVSRWESGKSVPSKPYLKAIKRIGSHDLLYGDHD